MAGPKENLDKGWKSIAEVNDIDTPEPFGRYFGCEHRVEENVKLIKDDHPFHHIFSTKTAAVAHQYHTNDFWEHGRNNKTWTRYHIYPRKCRMVPRDCNDVVPTHTFDSSFFVKSLEILSYGNGLILALAPCFAAQKNIRELLKCCCPPEVDC